MLYSNKTGHQNLRICLNSKSAFTFQFFAILEPNKSEICNTCYHPVTESKHTTLPIPKFRVEQTAQPAQTNSHLQILIYYSTFLILFLHLLLRVPGGLTSIDFHIHTLYVFLFLMSQPLSSSLQPP